MTTTAHLATVILHWPDLVEALGGTSAPTWPPAGRMTDHLRAIEQLDEDQLAYERSQALLDRILERADCAPDAPGQRPIPIDPRIYETMRIVRAVLLHCADAVAEVVQRDPIKPPPPRRASYARTRAERLAWEDHARRVQTAQDDAADGRRWRWTGIRPDAPYTALWLLGRVQGAPGPFRPLTDAEAERIATVARGAAERVEQALDVGERTAAIALPCPDCGGRLNLHGGAGASPVARCTACGKVWSGNGAVAA